jgi:fumarylacetoacetase
MALNETHDPELKSWVASANQPGVDFPIQNLPIGIFRRRGEAAPFRGGIAIGDSILDLKAAVAAGVLSGTALQAASEAAGEKLNGFMAMGQPSWSSLRLAVSRMLRIGSAEQPRITAALVKISDAEFAVPAVIGDFTDFYTSIYHAMRVGKIFRPDNPLMPNYKWVPVAYHCRSSSIGISGQTFPRPLGQHKQPDADAPTFGPSMQLDYELELGMFVGPGNAMGRPICLDSAEDHIFGLSLLNDWSARDIQSWEYQPLGPFLGKNFATTISPWIVSLEALEPFRAPWIREETEPQPLPYLESKQNRARGALDAHLEVSLLTEEMRKQHMAPVRLALSAYRHAYWTPAQMIAHHTSNGCNLAPGDFIGTGTQSGPGEAESGSMLELTAGGKQPFLLPTGETRCFIADGDTVVMRAWCEREGFTRIGFGDCAGTVLPAAW